MKIGIWDLETSSLYADSGIILCSSVKEYEKKGVNTVRADSLPNWKTQRSDTSLMILKIMEQLRKYDVLIAHNGLYFDKKWVNAQCIKHGIPPDIRFSKFIDPVQVSRRHLRLARHSLNALIDYFGIKEQKLHVPLEMWVKASHDGDKKTMDLIIRRCEMDVITLEKVYDKLRPLIAQVDNVGSYFR